jgi:type II secretory pathway component PulF
MPTYLCVAMDSSGKKKEFLKTADSKEAAERSFATGDWYLVSVAEESNKHGYGGKKRYPASTIREFTELTSVLLESGLTLKDALIVEKDIFSGKNRSALLDTIIGFIDKGGSFYNAIESCGEAFPSVYRGMIRIGDKTGSTEKMFPRLAEYLTEKKKIRDTLLSALMYPALVLTMVIVGMIGISVFLLPRLIELFSQLGGNAAKTLGANAEKMKATLLIFLIIVILLIISLPLLQSLKKKDKKFAQTFDSMLLHTPWIGTVVKAFQTMNFAFAMEILSSGTIPMEIALEESKAVVSNAAYRQAIDEVRSAIMRGESLSAACSTRDEFPTYVSRWLAVGERSGRADKVFAQIRKYFQSDTERITSRALALAEPALILVVGGIVLWVVVSFILPLFTIYGSVL